MKWGIYFGFFGLSMIKFLFAPFGAPHAGLNFIETYLSCISGAIFCAIIFYFSAEFFMIRAHKKRKLLIQQAKEKGIELKRKKAFTKTNKTHCKNETSWDHRNLFLCTVFLISSRWINNLC